MKPREELGAILREILGSGNVYFSPPSSIQMKYPCIRYEFSNFQTTYADNQVYKAKRRYTATVIDPDPDSIIPEKILTIPYCSSDRSYVADGLNHFVFTIFF